MNVAVGTDDEAVGDEGLPPVGVDDGGGGLEAPTPGAVQEPSQSIMAHSSSGAILLQSRPVLPLEQIVQALHSTPSACVPARQLPHWRLSATI